MHLNVIDIAVLAAYFVCMLGLGLYQARKIKSAGDFFAGGRKFNKFLMMMHALGTGTHADDPVVVVGAAFKNGLAGIWYTFIYLFVTPFYWIIAPLFRRSRFLTTADFFEARFGSKLGTLYAVWGIIIFAVNMGILLVGTAAIVTAVSGGAIDPVWAIAGMTVVFFVYGTAGGLVATVITESVQGLLIVVMSLLLIPFGVSKLGGFHGMHQAVTDPNMFALLGKVELNIWWVIAGSVSMLVGIVAQPHIMEVCASGKTEFEGRVGFTYGNMVKRLCSIGWALTGVIMIGMVAKQYVGPMEREAAFGTAIRTLLPPGFIGLMFAAILAAQMSTLSAFMVAASALLSRNIYKKHVRPEADDRQVLLAGRWAGAVVMVLSVVFALSQKSVADAIMWFWTLAAFTGVFMWAGVLWKRTNATGAWASFVVMFAIWFVVGEPGQAVKQCLGGHISWLGIYADKTLLQYRVAAFLPAGILALIIGSLLGKPHPKEKLDRFYALLRTPVGKEDELAAQGVDVVYAGASKGHPWELEHGRAVNVIGFLVALVISLLFVLLLWGVGRIGA